MPKVSVYLPDELYRRARERDLSLSAVTQRAVEEELRRHANDTWLRAVAARPDRVDTAIDTGRLMDEVRDEFGA